MQEVKAMKSSLSTDVHSSKSQARCTKRACVTIAWDCILFAIQLSAPGEHLVTLQPCMISLMVKLKVRLMGLLHKFTYGMNAISNGKLSDLCHPSMPRSIAYQISPA